MRLITNNPDTRGRSRLQELESRLHHGDLMIRQFEAESKPVGHLVKLWLELLKEYEIEFRADQTAA